MYNVLIERTAEKDMLRLPKKIMVEAVKRIQTLAEVPRPEGCKKLKGSKNDW